LSCRDTRYQLGLVFQAARVAFSVSAASDSGSAGSTTARSSMPIRHCRPRGTPRSRGVAYLGDSPHLYMLDAFGLTGEEVDERFGAAAEARSAGLAVEATIGHWPIIFRGLELT
jgi:hypothetical protein